MEGQSGLSELSIISWVSAFEGCPLTGVPLYPREEIEEIRYIQCPLFVVYSAFMSLIVMSVKSENQEGMLASFPGPAQLSVAFSTVKQVL